MLQPEYARGNNNVVETTNESLRRLKIRTPIYQLWDHDEVKSVCEKQSRLGKAEPQIAPPKYLRKYIDLRSDYGWKLVFGSETCKQQLINLLNAILKGSVTITSVNFGNVESQAEFISGKKTVYDIFCYDQLGRQYILEMQRSKQDFFFSRVFFYACRAVANQVLAGDKKYVASPIINIAMSDFSVDDNEPDQYIRHYALNRIHAPMQQESPMTLIFIELNKFKKRINQLETELDKWLYIIKNIWRLKEIPPILDNETFRPVFKRAIFNLLKPEEQMQYIQIDKEARDNRNKMSYALNEGVEKGIKKGIKKGIEKGIEKNKIETAAVMINNGYTDENIVTISKLPLIQVQQLRAKLLN